MKSTTIAALALVLAGHAAAADWALVDVGTLGGTMSYGAALSDAGHVVGCSETRDGAIHAYIYFNGSMTDLEAGSAGLSSCALAVNSKGIAAGRSSTGELVMWASATAITHMSAQGDVGGINESNVVVGTFTSGGQSRAFMFRDGALTDLGTMPGTTGTFTSATGINESNQVVGVSNGRGFLYANGTMRDLGTLGGNGATANDINDGGQVVGMSSGAQGGPTPFIYNGTMAALPSGPSFSSAIAINNSGLVVGSGEGIHGYLIDAAGTYTRLDTIPAVAAQGWSHMEPTGINDRGWIVGTGVNGNGNTHAFLLVPTQTTSVAQNPLTRVPRNWPLTRLPGN